MLDRPGSGGFATGVLLHLPELATVTMQWRVWTIEPTVGATLLVLAGQCTFLGHLHPVYPACNVYGTKLLIYRSKIPVCVVIETKRGVLYMPTNLWPNCRSQAPARASRV